MIKYLTGDTDNYLAGTTCYLSSPIEHCVDSSWRAGVVQHLENQFKINVIDPAQDTKQTWVEDLSFARRCCDYEAMARIAKRFVRIDLARVDRADFLIAYVPHKVCTTGVPHEVINSTNAKKPTMLVCPEGKNMIAAWFFGFVPHEVMFGGWNQCFMYLDEVNRGLHKHNHRWHYVYRMLNY